MEAMLQFIIMFAKKHLTQYPKSLVAGYVERDHDTMIETKIMSGGATLIKCIYTKNRVLNNATGRYFYRWDLTRERGFKLREDGSTYAWAKEMDRNGFTPCHRSMDLYSLKHFFKVEPVMADPFMSGATFIQPGDLIVQQYLDMHGITDPEDLYFRLGKEMGINKNDVTSPWEITMWNQPNMKEFRKKLAGNRKFTKDEIKRIAPMIMTNPMNLWIFRMAGRVGVPNLRDVTYTTDPDTRVYHGTKNAAMADYLAMGLRAVAPQRRLMFIQAILNEGGGNYMARDGREAIDTLNMLAGLRRAKVMGRNETMNFRTIGEFHEEARLRTRFIQQTNIEIAQKKNAELMDGVHGAVLKNDIVVVVPKDTHEVIAWGEEQHHCIGSYAQLAAQGQMILLGFRRGSEWVGHCSIESERCTQLLAKYNGPVDVEDRAIILSYLKKQGLISTTGGVFTNDFGQVN